MNILVIGSGAREHAITVALNRSKEDKRIFCIGSTVNPGIQIFCEDYKKADILDTPQIITQALKWQIELAIIGPEAPLEQGLADAFAVANISVVGPKRRLAQIESSKTYARELMLEFNIPGLPACRSFKKLEGIEAYLEELGPSNYVVKADGLMGGKGVKLAGEHLHSYQEALNWCQEIFHEEQTVIIEEKLLGQEFSLMCFCDGKRVVPMPLVQDHKRAYENDTGPNTGGMGSYSDANHSLPFLDQLEVDAALAINQAVLNALMEKEKAVYQGILYGSFIATKKGVYVIEFNARLGDPEALNVLSILESDFLNICQNMVEGKLQAKDIIFSHQATVCKYAVPNGYPDKPMKNIPIDISRVDPGVNLYLAAVDQQADGALLATGSRVAACVGVADDLVMAEQKTEQNVSQIEGEVYHRSDIGTPALIESKIRAMNDLRGRAE